MQHDLFTWILILACLLCLGAGIVWQVFRRFDGRRAQKKVHRRVERVGRRPESTIPKTANAEEENKEGPKEYQGVARPVMLAITTLPDRLSASDLFIQRALEIDEPFYNEIPVDPKELKPLEALFARNVALARAWRRFEPLRLFAQLLPHDSRSLLKGLYATSECHFGRLVDRGLG